MGGTSRTSTEEKQEVQERQFGSHLAWVEEPDLFGIRFVGPVQANELRGIFAWQDEWGSGRPSFFVLCDLSKIGGVSQETRQCLNERTKRHNAVISVCFGMTFAIRILVEMADRARRYLGRDRLSELMMVATEAEARAYIEARRARNAFTR